MKKEDFKYRVFIWFLFCAGIFLGLWLLSKEIGLFFAYLGGLVFLWMNFDEDLQLDNDGHLIDKDIKHETTEEENMMLHRKIYDLRKKLFHRHFLLAFILIFIGFSIPYRHKYMSIEEIEDCMEEPSKKEIVSCLKELIKGENQIEYEYEE